MSGVLTGWPNRTNAQHCLFHGERQGWVGEWSRGQKVKSSRSPHLDWVATYSRFANVKRDDRSSAGGNRRQQRVVTHGRWTSWDRPTTESVRRSTSPVDLDNGGVERRVTTTVWNIGIPLRLTRTVTHHHNHSRHLYLHATALLLLLLHFTLYISTTVYIVQHRTTERIGPKSNTPILILR